MGKPRKCCVRPGSPTRARCAPRSWAASRCCCPTSGASPMRARRRLVGPGHAARWLLLAAALVAGCSRGNGEIRGSGTIEMDEIDIGSTVGGRVLRLWVTEGDTVQAGDTLAVLDRGEVAAQVAAQTAEAE